MNKLGIYGLSLILIALSLPVSSQSIAVVEGVKIKNGLTKEALFYYHNNWRELRVKALEMGFIESFNLIEQGANSKTEFDLLLITNYINAAQQSLADERFSQLIAAHSEVKLLNQIQPSEFRQSLFVNIAKGLHQSKDEAYTPVKEVLLEGLAHPWSMAFLTEQLALVSEKDGHLLKVDLQSKEKTVIKNFPEDLANKVSIDATQYEPGIYPTSLNGRTGSFNLGIFDVLLDPNFIDNRYIYVAYSAKKADTFTTKVIRAILKDDELTQIKSIFEAAPYTPGAWHFGGGMTFGQDGKLYITVGERLFNEVNQPDMPIAQNMQDKRGKIHRINTDGSIPIDNPDFFEQGISSIYAAGIRAAQGLTVEPTSGNIWFSEHGTHQGDEINLLKAGANYGWPVHTTGRYRHAEYQPPALADRAFTDPKWFWKQTVAPTGLTFYTGDEFPEWKNNLFVAGLSKGSLWRVTIEGTTIKSVESLFVDSPVRSRKVVQSPQGKLYMLTDEDNGKIIRIRKTHS